jgi:hypothetical protein
MASHPALTAGRGAVHTGAASGSGRGAAVAAGGTGDDPTAAGGVGGVGGHGDFLLCAYDISHKL